MPEIPQHQRPRNNLGIKGSRTMAGQAARDARAPRKVRERYTPEYQAWLDRQAAKRRAHRRLTGR